MQKLSKRQMDGSNRVWAIPFSRYFSYKFWWRHNDVRTDVFFNFTCSNKCTNWPTFICMLAIIHTLYGSRVIWSLNFDDVTVMEFLKGLHPIARIIIYIMEEEQNKLAGWLAARTYTNTHLQILAGSLFCIHMRYFVSTTCLIGGVFHLLT